MSQAVRGLAARRQIPDGGEEQDAEGQVFADDGAGHVDVHDALHVALDDLAGGDPERHHQPGYQREHGAPSENANHLIDQPSMTNSNVRTPTAMKMASAAPSRASHREAVDSPSPERTASVAFTVPSSTGTSRGSSKTGKSSSRARRSAVIAAKSVPSVARPTVPRITTTRSEGRTPVRSRLKKMAKRTSRSASTVNISARLPASLPR